MSGGVMPLLEIEGLNASFGSKQVLKSVGFALEAGTCLGLVGESGSGKSLTALSVLGLLPRGATVNSGNIRFEGGELLGLQDDEMRKLRGASISMIFQEPFTCLNPVIRVDEQIAEVLT